MNLIVSVSEFTYLLLICILSSVGLAVSKKQTSCIPVSDRFKKLKDLVSMMLRMQLQIN